MLNSFTPYLQTLTTYTSHTIVGLESPVPYPYKSETILSDHMPDYCGEFRAQNDELALLLTTGLKPKDRFIIYRCSGGSPGMVCRLPNTNNGISVWKYPNDTIKIQIVKFTKTSYNIDENYFPIISNTKKYIIDIIHKFLLEGYDNDFIKYVCMSCDGNGLTCNCTCEGCKMGHENQQGHMDIGGCLYISSDDEEEYSVDEVDSGCET